jgi:hypothetical protein
MPVMPGAPHWKGSPDDNGPTPPDNGNMEARVAKLEAAMEYVQRDIGEIKADIREIKQDARTDFRLTWGSLIAGFIGLAALMAKGFGWLN